MERNAKPPGEFSTAAEPMLVTSSSLRALETDDKIKGVTSVKNQMTVEEVKTR